MTDLTDIRIVKGLQSNLRVTFDSPCGKEAMKFIKEIGSWTPNMLDTNETNDIIARDANRRLIGMIDTILTLTPEQIVALANKKED